MGEQFCVDYDIFKEKCKHHLIILNEIRLHFINRLLILTSSVAQRFGPLWALNESRVRLSVRAIWEMHFSKFNLDLGALGRNPGIYIVWSEDQILYYE